jgi:hypothetical protein
MAPAKALALEMAQTLSETARDALFAVARCRSTRIPVNYARRAAAPSSEGRDNNAAGGNFAYSAAE